MKLLTTLVSASIVGSLIASFAFAEKSVAVPAILSCRASSEATQPLALYYLTVQGTFRKDINIFNPSELSLSVAIDDEVIVENEKLEYTNAGLQHVQYKLASSVNGLEVNFSVYGGRAFLKHTIDANSEPIRAEFKCKFSK